MSAARRRTASGCYKLKWAAGLHKKWSDQPTIENRGPWPVLKESYSHDLLIGTVEGAAYNCSGSSFETILLRENRAGNNYTGFSCMLKSGQCLWKPPWSHLWKCWHAEKDFQQSTLRIPKPPRDANCVKQSYRGNPSSRKKNTLASVVCWRAVNDCGNVPGHAEMLKCRGRFQISIWRIPKPPRDTNCATQLRDNPTEEPHRAGKKYTCFNCMLKSGRPMTTSLITSAEMLTCGRGFPTSIWRIPKPPMQAALFQFWLPG